MPLLAFTGSLDCSCCSWSFDVRFKPLVQHAVIVISDSGDFFSLFARIHLSACSLLRFENIHASCSPSDISLHSFVSSSNSGDSGLGKGPLGERASEDSTASAPTDSSKAGGNISAIDSSEDSTASAPTDCTASERSESACSCISSSQFNSWKPVLSQTNIIRIILNFNDTNVNWDSKFEIPFIGNPEGPEDDK